MGMFFTTQVLLLLAIYMTITFVINAAYEVINYYKDGESNLSWFQGLIVSVLWATFVTLIML